MVETLAEDGGAVLMSTLAGRRMMVLRLKVQNVERPLHGLKIWEKKQVEVCMGLVKAARPRYDGGTLSQNSRTSACLDSPVRSHSGDERARILRPREANILKLQKWDYSNPGYLDALKHLTDLKEEGKIKTVALTNFDTERLQLILENGIPIVSNQTLNDRYGTVMGGLLSEKFLDTNISIPFAGPPLNTPSLQKYKRKVPDFTSPLVALDIKKFTPISCHIAL
ncbi:hypothetical protein ACLOJK_020715 [Asimina triloba]